MAYVLPDKIKNKIAAYDEKLNKAAGYPANAIQETVERLLVYGSVEVGYRTSTGKADNTLRTYREWMKILRMLQKDLKIIIEPQKHDNGWATLAGGFWNSNIYRIEES